MFSKENRRFTTLVIALVIVVLATIQGVGRTISEDHAKDAYIVGGVSAVVILQFLGMIRAEQERKEARQSRNEITEKVESIEKKTNGNLTTALTTGIKTAAEEVKKAACAPAPGQEQMPRTPAELQSLIKLFFREMSEELVHRATAEAATKATRDAVELATRTAAKTVIEELRAAGYRIERP